MCTQIMESTVRNIYFDNLHVCKVIIAKVFELLLIDGNVIVTILMRFFTF